MAVNHEVVTMICWMLAGNIAWSCGMQGVRL